MEFKLEERQGCAHAYSYRAGWDEIRAPYNLIAEEVRKEAELPGFRKGKAPLELVKAKFSSVIAGRLKEKTLKEVADKISKDENLQLFSPPHADDPVLKVGDDLAGTIYFELNPEIPEIETEGIEVEVVKRETTEEQINSIIQSFRQSKSTMITIEEEAAEEGDFCSVKLLKQGEKKEREAFLHCQKESDNPFEKSLAGKRGGESYEVELPPGAKEGEGKFTVKLDKIIRQSLPGLDDDFAAQCGFKSLAELKEESKKQAEAANEQMWKEERDDKILLAILNKHPFDVPPTLVENQLKRDLDRFAGELHKRRIDPEKANIDWNKLVESKKPEVEKSVRAYFIVKKLIEKEKIEISDEEADAVITRIAEKERTPFSKAKQVFEQNGQIEDIKFKLAQEKIFEIVANRVKIKLVDANRSGEGGTKDVDPDSR